MRTGEDPIIALNNDHMDSTVKYAYNALGNYGKVNEPRLSLLPFQQLAGEEKVVRLLLAGYMVLQTLSFHLQEDIHANGFLENILVGHVVSVRKHVRIPPSDKRGRERR
jgi:hypothetical protein